MGSSCCLLPAARFFVYTGSNDDAGGGGAVGTGPVYGIIFDLMGTLATFTGTRQDLHAACVSFGGLNPASTLSCHLKHASFGTPGEPCTVWQFLQSPL